MIAWAIGVLLLGWAAVVEARRGGDLGELRERVARLAGKVGFE